MKYNKSINVAIKGNNFASIRDRISYRPPNSDMPDPLGVRSVGWANIPCEASTFERKIEFAQIIWSIAGIGVMTINGKDFEVRAGEGGIFFPGDMHMLAGGAKGWTYRWFTLDGICASSILSTLGLRQKLLALGECPENDFEHLQQLVAQPEPNALRSASSLAYSILSGMSKASLTSSKKTSENKQMKEAKNLLEKSISNPTFSVLEIADQLKINRSAFSRAFKISTGISPKDYLNSLRISKAASLLRNTNLQVSEVSMQCGFNEANYFSKFFHKYMHESPLKFRERRTP